MCRVRMGFPLWSFFSPIGTRLRDRRPVDTTRTCVVVGTSLMSARPPRSPPGEQQNGGNHLAAHRRCTTNRLSHRTMNEFAHPNANVSAIWKSRPGIVHLSTRGLSPRLFAIREETLYGHCEGTVDFVDERAERGREMFCLFVFFVVGLERMRWWFWKWYVDSDVQELSGGRL